MSSGHSSRQGPSGLCLWHTKGASHPTDQLPLTELLNVVTREPLDRELVLGVGNGHQQRGKAGAIPPRGLDSAIFSLVCAYLFTLGG